MNIRDAILGSIEKWNKILDGTGKDEFSLNCPLCQKFSCESCPTDCGEGSVWKAWATHHVYEHEEGFWFMEIECDECRRLAEEVKKKLEHVLTLY
jgi:hypothetical protein